MTLAMAYRPYQYPPVVKLIKSLMMTNGIEKKSIKKGRFPGLNFKNTSKNIKHQFLHR